MRACGLLLLAAAASALDEELTRYVKLAEAAAKVILEGSPSAMQAKAARMVEEDQALKDALLDTDIDRTLDMAQSALYGINGNATDERECVRVRIPADDREGSGLFKLDFGEWAFRFTGGVINKAVAKDDPCRKARDARGATACFLNTNGQRGVPFLGLYDATGCAFPPTRALPMADDMNTIHARCGEPFFGRVQVTDVEVKDRGVVQGFWSILASPRRLLRIATHDWDDNLGEIVGDFCRPTPPRAVASEAAREMFAEKGAAVIQEQLNIPAVFVKKDLRAAFDYMKDAALAERQRQKRDAADEEPEPRGREELARRDALSRAGDKRHQNADVEKLLEQEMIRHARPK